MKETERFALTHDLSEVTYRESQKGEWNKKKSWQDLSFETRKYVDHFSKDAEREKQREEHRVFSEEEMRFTVLEVHAEDRLLAKFNLKYTE